MRNLRTLTASASHDVSVRLERPRVSVVSTHHFINHGGTEFIVYRATPEDVESGVVVGEVEYPGFPAKGATVEGVTITDPALRVAFFALALSSEQAARITPPTGKFAGIGRPATLKPAAQCSRA